MTVHMRSVQTNNATPAGRVLFQSGPGRPEREWFVYRATTAGAGAPILVIIHGIASNPAEYAFRMVEAAERRGLVVVAPLFAKGAYGQYQQVVDPRSGARADLALLDIVAAVAKATGANAKTFHLFGVSGGAQFVHRFTMLHPERVAAAGLAAAGWYTLPDPDAAWPLGQATHPVEAGEFDPAYLDVPYHLFVGERDIERDGSLRQSEALDLTQGMNRLERARTWVSAMTSAGAKATLTLLPETGHFLGRAFERRGLAELILNQIGLAATSPQAAHDHVQETN